jgi:hypothetical protein
MNKVSYCWICYHAILTKQWGWSQTVCAQPKGDSDDSDDEFLIEFRKKRIEELKSKAIQTTRRFGYCKDVDTTSFLTEVS